MSRLLLSWAVLAVVPLLAADDQEGEKKEALDQMHPRAKMETSLGDIILELDAEKAPISVNNFLQYAEDGFYTGTIFHRVMGDFMIQGGGFTPDMAQKQEGLRPPIKNEWQNGLKNERGTIAMARTQVPDSATSQFFINVVDNVQGSRRDLDTPRGGAAYAVFGKVVEGMEVVDKIKDTEVTTHPKLQRMGKVVPVEPVVIKSVTLLEGYDRSELSAKLKAIEEAAAAADTDRAKAFAETLAKGADENGNKVESTGSGLKYIVLKPGEGDSPKQTDTVVVHYTGWLLKDGTQFDSSVERGTPATFRLDGVIRGWTEGVRLMKVGEKRRLIIPPEMAYGDRGRPKIPPNSTLVFDVELMAIK